MIRDYETVDIVEVFELLYDNEDYYACNADEPWDPYQTMQYDYELDDILDVFGCPPMRGGWVEDVARWRIVKVGKIVA